jgi:hypothetical protein
MIGAGVLAVAGVAGLVVGLLAKRRLDAMRSTATVDCMDIADAAGDGEAKPCEVVGTAGIEERLVAPLSGLPCVWYRSSVSRRYYDRRGDRGASGGTGGTGNRTRTQVVSRQESSAPFTIRDSSGVALILPEGAKVIGETKSVDQFEPNSSGRLAAGEGSLASRAISIGLNLLTQTDRDTIGYEYREWIIREGANLYVRAGAMRDHSGRAWLQKPTSGPYLISTKSEATLTRQSRLTMLVGFGAGVSALAAGLVLAVVSFT